MSDGAAATPPLLFTKEVRAAYARLRSPLWVYDHARQRFVWANDAALVLWKKTSLEHFVSTPLHDDMTIGVRTRLLSCIQRLQSGERISDVWTFYPANVPTTLNCDLELVELEEGGLAVLSHGHPETLGRPVLTDDNIRMLEIMRHLPVCIGVYSQADGTVVLQNPLCSTLFGVNHSCYDMFTKESDAAALRAALDQRSTYRTEARVRTCHGLAWHAIEVVFMYDPVSSSKVMLLYQVNMESFSMVQALRKAQQEAVAANEAKTRFLSTVSHEIRTPLHGILGFAELLETTPLSDEQASYVDMLRLSGRSLLSIINDILQLSRIEAGMLDVTFVPYCLRDCVDEVVNIVFGAASEKKIQVSWAVDPAMSNDFYGDSKHLRQILINLMGNGVKFTPRGGCVSVNVFQVDDFCTNRTWPVSAEAPNALHLLSRELQRDHSLNLETLTKNAIARATVVLNKSPMTNADKPECKLLLFAVADTGIGMTPDVTLEQLCKPFTQLDSSNTRSYEGTGLGLAITKQLVEAMGGCMFFYSTLGAGSTFCILLPAIDAPPTRRSDLVHSRIRNSSSSMRDSPSRSIEENMPERLRRSILSDEDKGLMFSRRSASSINNRSAASDDGRGLMYARRSTPTDPPIEKSPSLTFSSSSPASMDGEATLMPSELANIITGDDLPRTIGHGTEKGSAVSWSAAYDSQPNGIVSPINPSSGWDTSESSSSGTLTAASDTLLSHLLHQVLPAEPMSPPPPPAQAQPLQVAAAELPKQPPPQILNVSDEDLTPKPPAQATVAKAIERLSPLVAGTDPSQPQQSLCHVLVVEDNQVNRLLLGRILSLLSCQYTMAFHGQEAVDVLSQRGPAEYDLIFMDVSMPVMDGLEATRELLKMFPDPEGRPIIVGMTANVMQDNRDTCLQAGMDDFLSKPATMVDIRSTIEKYTGRRRQVARRLLDAAVSPTSK